MYRKARKCPMPGCGVKLTDKAGQPNSKHLDHIIPQGVGGTHSHGNVRIICAACNVRRPKDGSDYVGPVTLWAALPGMVARSHGGTNKDTCRKGLHPWVPENIKVVNGGKVCAACREAADRQRNPLRPCAGCGKPAALPGSAIMCPACRLAAVRQAMTLRLADRLSWDEVATQVGYASGTGIRDAVRQIAGGDAFERVSRLPVALSLTGSRCECGANAWRSGRCRDCVTRLAQRAVYLRTAEGWTLRMIADDLGYSSITTVTSLMKTVVTIEARIGRPSSKQT